MTSKDFAPSTSVVEETKIIIKNYNWTLTNVEPLLYVCSSPHVQEQDIIKIFHEEWLPY